MNYKWTRRFFLMGLALGVSQSQKFQTALAPNLHAQDLKDELDALEDPPEEDLSQLDEDKPAPEQDEALPPDEDLGLEEDLSLDEEENPQTPQTPPPPAPPAQEPQVAEPEVPDVSEDGLAEDLNLDEPAQEPLPPAQEGPAVSGPAESEPAPAPEEDATTAALTGIEDELTARVNSIQFRQLKDRVRLTVTVDRSVDYNQNQRQERKQFILELKNVKFSKPGLSRVFDTGEFDGPLALVQPFESKIGSLPSVKILFQLREKAEPRISRSGNQIFVDFMLKGQANRKLFKDQSTETAPEFPETFISVDGKARYTGTRISLNLKDAALKDVLSLLSGVAGRNFVIAGQTDAKVTLSVKDVPWDQVLAILLVNNKLGYQKVGNIYRIMPVDQIKSEMDAIVRAQEDKINLLPLETRLIPISYARASELNANVTGLLSRRGKLSVDTRTNSLVITDTSESLDKVMAYIQSVDKQTALVEIQARIVEAREEFSRNLSLNWELGPIAGGRFQDSTINLGPGDITGSRVATGNTRLRIGNLNSLNSIQALLGLAETKNQARVIASPKVTVVDNRTATISRGDSTVITVPGNNGSPGAVQTISANLTLNVTPQVTSDGFVLMQVAVSRNLPAGATATQQTTRQVSTEMLVESGKTGVIGGIYVVDKQKDQTGWPFFGSLPILGALFKNTSNLLENMSELLIFISPRILNADKTFLAYKEAAPEMSSPAPSASAAPVGGGDLGGSELDDDVL